MQITINGKTETVKTAMAVSEMIASKNLADSQVVIMINGNIIKKTEWDAHLINDEDNIEILKFVGGG